VPGREWEKGKTSIRRPCETNVKMRDNEDKEETRRGRMPEEGPCTKLLQAGHCRPDQFYEGGPRSSEGNRKKEAVNQKIL